MSYRRIFVVVMAGLLVAGSAFARGKKVKRSELPPAVERTLDLEAQGARIKRLSQENKNGQIYYKAKMKVDGHSKEVLIDTNGEVMRVGEQVPVKTLPADVKAGIQAKAGFLGRITKVESVTKNDRLVAYQARTEKPIFYWPGVIMLRSTVQVGPDGKYLDHKE